MSAMIRRAKDNSIVGGDDSEWRSNDQTKAVIEGNVGGWLKVVWVIAGNVGRSLKVMWVGDGEWRPR